jgi:hypothetical protein
MVQFVYAYNVLSKIKFLIRNVSVLGRVQEIKHCVIIVVVVVVRVDGVRLRF